MFPFVPLHQGCLFLLDIILSVFGCKGTIFYVHLSNWRCVVDLHTIDSSNTWKATLQSCEQVFLPMDVNAEARDLIMWLLDLIFFNVPMPNFLLIVSIFLDLSKAKNNWHLLASDLLSKYCFIIWEQWWRIVHLATLPSIEVNLLSSTCMCLWVLFRFDAKFLVVWNVGVTFTSTTCWQLRLGDWTSSHGCYGATFSSSWT